MGRLKRIETRLRKVCKASLPELWCRTTEYAHQLKERLNCHFPSQKMPITNFGELCRRAANLFPGQTASSIRTLLNESNPLVNNLREQIFAQYGAGSDNAFWLFDIKLDIFQPICWHTDPQSGSLWPRRFYADISLGETNSSKDIKYIWELGRQLFVVELARGWAVSRDDKAARRAVELIDSFLRENPPYVGVHWASALEVAVRTIHWLWAIAALSDRKDSPPEFEKGLVKALIVNADFLMHHLSYYSSPYNHIIGEATALYLLSYALKDERQAWRWASIATKVLEQFGPRQFYKDGVSVEQSSAYHFYTLGFLMQAVVCARLQGQKLHQVEDIVPRAVRAAMAFRQPDGSWPPIGDADSARAIPVVPANYWDFSGLCNLAAVLWRDPTLVANTELPGQEITWLLGYNGLEMWRKLADSSCPSGNGPAATGDPATQVFTESGYAIVKNDFHFLVFDSGPLAAGVHSDGTPSAAHGHADMLHVTYWRNGKQWLFDSGLYCYNGDSVTLKHCRGPQSHNTIEIEGCPIAEDAGGLAWVYVSKPPTINVTKLPKMTLLQANWQYGNDAMVRRKVAICSAGPVVIIDRLTTNVPRLVHWNWQLPPESAPIIQTAKQLTWEARGYQEVFEVCSSQDWTKIEINRADSSPAGWRYYGYRRRQPGCRLRVAVHCPKKAILVTCIRRPSETVDVQAAWNFSIRLGPSTKLTVLYEDRAEPLIIYGEEVPSGDGADNACSKIGCAGIQ